MNKKFLTKLLNQTYRHTILRQMPQHKLNEYQIPQYARYVVDSCIINRCKKYADKKEYGYGFSPIQFLCAVIPSGIDKKFFEFNTVNHFLVNTDGDSAVEVVMCILIKWVQEDNSVINFDIDIIDSELSKLEADFKKQLESKQTNTDEKTTETEIDGDMG